MVANGTQTRPKHIRCSCLHPRAHPDVLNAQWSRVILIRGFLSVLVLLVSSAPAVASNCEVRPSYDARREPLSPSMQAAVNSKMRVAEILATLGPAHEDLCSGLYCPAWHLADGSRIVVRFSDPCGKPVQVEHEEVRIEVGLSLYFGLVGEDELHVMKLGKGPKAFTFKLDEVERLSLKLTPLDGCKVGIEILDRKSVTTTRPLSWPAFFEPGATFAIGIHFPRHRQEVRGSVAGVGACSRIAGT